MYWFVSESFIKQIKWDFLHVLSSSYNTTNLMDDLKIHTRQLDTSEKRSKLRLHWQQNQGQIYPAAYDRRSVIRRGRKHTWEIMEPTAVFWFLYFSLLLYLSIPMFFQFIFSVCSMILSVLNCVILCFILVYSTCFPSSHFSFPTSPHLLLENSFCSCSFSGRVKLKCEAVKKRLLWLDTVCVLMWGLWVMFVNAKQRSLCDWR